MYELRLSPQNRNAFISEAKARMAERGMTVADLAVKINRPVNTVYKFFGCSSIQNRFVAAEIADALDMHKKGVGKGAKM